MIFKGEKLSNINVDKLSDKEWEDLCYKYGDLTYCERCRKICPMDDIESYGCNDNGEVLCSQCFKK